MGLSSALLTQRDIAFDRFFIWNTRRCDPTVNFAYEEPRQIAGKRALACASSTATAPQMRHKKEIEEEAILSGS